MLQESIQAAGVPTALPCFEYPSELALRHVSPEWIPLLFVASVICLFFFLLRPRERSIRRLTILRVLIVEGAYLSAAYLILDVLEHPVTEALFGASLLALVAGVAVPNRVYRRLDGKRRPAAFPTGVPFKSVPGLPAT